MPLTFPAHQSVVVPLKMWFPRRFDGLALVVGAGAPDVLVGTGLDWTFLHGPRSLPIVVAATVLYSVILRRFALPGLFRYAPTVAGVDLRVYGAMAAGRPSLVTTTVSALIGGASHQLWDSFTHSGRPAAKLFGFDNVLFNVDSLPVGGDVTAAKLFQYLGHSVGSLVTLALLYLIARRRSPGVLDWRAADRLLSQPRSHPLVPAAVGIAIFVAGAASRSTFGNITPFVIILGWAIAFVLLGAWTERGGVR